MMRRWQSLGGWCGPSLMLSKLGLREPLDASDYSFSFPSMVRKSIRNDSNNHHGSSALELQLEPVATTMFLPFDTVRCTWDGIIELTKNGFGDGLENYLPANYKTRMQKVGTPQTENNEKVEDNVIEDEKGEEVDTESSKIDIFQYDLSKLLWFPPDPVDIWLLFRSQHACFTHYDLNNINVLSEIELQTRAWENLFIRFPQSFLTSNKNSNNTNRSPMSGGVAADLSDVTYNRPITFIRTIISEDPEEEIQNVQLFFATMNERYSYVNGYSTPNSGKTVDHPFDFRLVLVMHNQTDKTEPLFVIQNDFNDKNICVGWNLKREALNPEFEKTNQSSNNYSIFDESHAGYQHIITSMSQEIMWKRLYQNLPRFDAYMKKRAHRPFSPHTKFSLIKGIPAVRGTCKGFGSTLAGVQDTTLSSNSGCGSITAAGESSMTSFTSVDATAENVSVKLDQLKCCYCGSVDGHALKDKAQFDSYNNINNTSNTMEDNSKKENSRVNYVPLTEEEKDILLLEYALAGDEVSAVEKACLKFNESCIENETKALKRGSNEVYRELLKMIGRLD